MKGVIQLVVEVNYDEMLKAENLEGIHAYTGIQTEDRMMKEHMGALGNKIVAQLEGLPYVKYNVDGQFYPSTPEQPQTEAVEESVEEEEEIPPLQVDEHEAEALGLHLEEQSAQPDEEDVLMRLRKDLDTISIEHGIPQAIKVNGEFIECLKKEVASVLDNEALADETPSHYMGFELRIEGMEEPYVIEFKPYDGTDLRSFTYEINKQKS